MLFCLRSLVQMCKFLIFNRKRWCKTTSNSKKFKAKAKYIGLVGFSLQHFSSVSGEKCYVHVKILILEWKTGLKCFFVGWIMQINAHEWPQDWKSGLEDKAVSVVAFPSPCCGEGSQEWALPVVCASTKCCEHCQLCRARGHGTEMSLRLSRVY